MLKFSPVMSTSNSEKAAASRRVRHNRVSKAPVPPHPLAWLARVVARNISGAADHVQRLAESLLVGLGLAPAVAVEEIAGSADPVPGRADIATDGGQDLLPLLFAVRQHHVRLPLRQPAVQDRRPSG
ncbi:hypothetical protein AB0C81_18765 [Streptomyces roseoverticillatus]|uniref:hypothetical protein n=1 Tax=Streptomyces roseoverticillatus TaxID=66429 RepID=UPI0033E14BEA